MDGAIAQGGMCKEKPPEESGKGWLETNAARPNRLSCTDDAT